MHEVGGEVQWSGKKFSGVFERRRRMKIYRPLAMLTGVCARYKKLG
jgi:lipoate-protein ligase A